MTRNINISALRKIIPSYSFVNYISMFVIEDRKKLFLENKLNYNRYLR